PPLKNPGTPAHLRLFKSCSSTKLRSQVNHPPPSLVYNVSVGDCCPCDTLQTSGPRFSIHPSIVKIGVQQAGFLKLPCGPTFKRSKHHCVWLDLHVHDPRHCTQAADG
ncbi:unnamed protein product, partial [Ectocarpus sp. 4 AP-2014]